MFLQDNVSIVIPLRNETSFRAITSSFLPKISVHFPISDQLLLVSLNVYSSFHFCQLHHWLTADPVACTRFELSVISEAGRIAAIKSWLMRRIKLTIITYRITIRLWHKIGSILKKNRLVIIITIIIITPISILKWLPASGPRFLRLHTTPSLVIPDCFMQMSRRWHKDSQVSGWRKITSCLSSLTVRLLANLFFC